MGFQLSKLKERKAAKTKLNTVGASNGTSGPNAYMSDSNKSPPIAVASDSQSVAVGHFESLLPKLTLEEKISLLSGRDFISTPGVPRLGIPSLKLLDSVNGVKSSLAGGGATASFPSTTCYGSTWNVELMARLGERLAFQAKLKSAQVILGPTVNIHRDPRGGRNFECFSEDPLVSGLLGAAIVNGMQANGVAACVKHFVCNDSETQRRAYDVVESINARALREIYMAAFQHLLRNSNPAGVMTAYNKIDGIFASESPIIEEVLRGTWGYDGCIISDWFGTRSGTPAINAGLDLEMPMSVFRGEALIKDVKDGKVSESLIDTRARHVLRLTDRTKGSHSSDEEKSPLDDETNQVARDIAAEGIVLLKNDNNVLPLEFGQPLKVAVIGDPAQHPSITGGGSAASVSQYIQRPIDCLRDAHSDPKEIRFAEGVRTNVIIPMVPCEKTFAQDGRNGVDITYYNDDSDIPVSSEYLEAATVLMLGHLKPGLHSSGFRFEMSTKLVPNSNGLHTLAVRISGAFQLYVDDDEVLTGPAPNITTEQFLFNHQLLESRVQLTMNANQSYDIKLVTHSREMMVGEPTPHGATLCFEEYYSTDKAISEASTLAAQSDVSVVFAGRNNQHESEGFDLVTTLLPANQTDLIQAVAAASKRTILVLYCGNPIDVSPYVDHVDAILVAHFPGQEGGQALADIITGKVNPSGKLTTTWFRQLSDAPSFQHFPASQTENGPEIRYTEGVAVGYRSTQADMKAQYCFGFGLSYTTFNYTDLHTTITPHDKKERLSTLKCSVTVTNTGSRAGKEVVQVFISPPSNSTVWRPRRELKAFTKVLLQPGEERNIILEVDTPIACSYWDEKTLKWRTEKGLYSAHVGDARSDFEITDELGWNSL